MKKILLLTCFLAGLASAADDENNYECIADMVTGFHHDAQTGAWNQATFLPGERFAITRLSDEIYKAERIDENSSWSAICQRRSDQSEDSFSCRQGTNELHFNRKALRFTAFRYFGYWNGSQDSLSIAIGRCAVN